jgi:predicted RNA methylase
MNLQPPVSTYTILERAAGLYKITLDVFNWNKSGDCVTPMSLVRSQFRSVKTDGTICIPGAGVGSYVIGALEAGFKPENIVAIELEPAYYELGSALFKRFGVTYIKADFLSWDTQMKFDVIIGNPPYGKNASLAVKFLNKSAELSDYISFVLPRTFRKPSVLNRIHPNLHLSEDLDTPDETFGGTIITCRQKWERREETRERILTHTKHPDLLFVSKEESNVCVGRVGASAGKVLTKDYSHLTEQHYFLNIPDSVTERLTSVQPILKKLARAATVGMPSLSKHELISAYLETVG